MQAMHWIKKKLLHTDSLSTQIISIHPSICKKPAYQHQCVMPAFFICLLLHLVLSCYVSSFTLTMWSSLFSPFWKVFSFFWCTAFLLCHMSGCADNIQMLLMSYIKNAQRVNSHLYRGFRHNRLYFTAIVMTTYCLGIPSYFVQLSPIL